MNYYIAKDRFGNNDLRHYGVKGMKWGVVNEELPVGAEGTSRNEKSSSGNQRMSGSTDYSYRIHKSGMSDSVKTANISRSKASSESEKSGDSELDAKIADAEANYKTALTNLQMMARISLAQGFSPNSDPDYISARKALIKAKYELDQLRIDQQAEIAKNPPTMAEQKRAMDSQAREERKEAAKSGTEQSDDYLELRKAWINQAFDGKDTPDSMKKLKDSKR